MNAAGYRAAVDAAAIFSETDLDGNITYVNQKFCDISGYSPAEIIGKNHRILKSGTQPAAFFRELWETLRAGKPWSGVICNRAKDGRLYWMNSTIVPLIDERTGQPCKYVSIRFDLTEEKIRANEMLSKMEAEYLASQQDKLAALGQLSAGLAHEINNPISFVAANLSTLEEYLHSLMELAQANDRQRAANPRPALDAEIEQLKEQIEFDFIQEDAPALLSQTRDGIERIRRIVRDLKEFARADQASFWTLADLHAGIESTLSIVRREVENRADVVRQYGELPDIECRPAELNQVFMSLLVNAAQAITSEHGTITIRTGVAGEDVWVDIQDNGCGIPQAHLNRIFDPFFATKEVGEGTGLGLSSAQGIVSRHGGRITVTSTVGEGTTFRVTLPQRHPAAPAA